MWAGGPAMPSPGDPQAEPTIAKAINGGYDLLGGGRCASLLFQNVNLAKLFLNLFDVFGATGMSGQILLARYRHPAASSRYDRYCNPPAVLKGLQFFRKSPN